MRGPKTRASIRRVAIDAGSLEEVRRLRAEREAIAAGCGVVLHDDGFVFSTDPATAVAPHPEPMTHAFRRLRVVAGVSDNIHLHSLRHIQATELDPIISEAQKQARLGWSTVHMSRHYTDTITEEERRAAEHIGGLLGQLGHEGTRSVRQRRSSVRYRAASSAGETSPSTSRSTARRGTR